MLGVPVDEMSDVGSLLYGPAMAGTEVSVRMSILDKKTSGDLVKLVIFIVVTTLATGVLVVLIGNLSFTSRPVTTRRSSPTPPAWSRATTSGSPG